MFLFSVSRKSHRTVEKQGSYVEEAVCQRKQGKLFLISSRGCSPACGFNRNFNPLQQLNSPFSIVRKPGLLQIRADSGVLKLFYHLNNRRSHLLGDLFSSGGKKTPVLQNRILNQLLRADWFWKLYIRIPFLSGRQSSW